MDTAIDLRQPNCNDGAQLHQLVSLCPPLDLNSAYLYHLIGLHHSSTSVVAEAEGKLVGAVTGYLVPESPHILFVWQVAVHADARGQGLAMRMLEHVHSSLPEVNTIHTTIGPSNAASHALFARYAERQQAQLNRVPCIPADACGVGHEAEELIIISTTPTSKKG